MKRIVTAVLSALLCLSVAAQSMRTVTGSVVDSDGNPIAGAVISEKGGKEICKTSEDGRFTVSVTYSVRYLTASAEMYLSADAEVDGSFLVFRLKADQNAIRAKKEAEERTKAEEQARQEAEKAKAEAQARAEEQARIQAEKEEQARIAAEKAKAEAEAKAAETRRIREAKVLERKRLDDEYGKKFRNKGIVNTLELSYGYQAAKGEVIYTNLGYYEYANLSPVSADYMIGYRFNRSFTLSAGAGFCYSLSNLRTIGDTFDEATYGQPTYSSYDVPVYLNGRAYFGRGKVQPMVSVSVGWYLMSNTLMADAGVGCAFRFARMFNMYVLASVRTTPWPSFQGPSWEGYKPAVTPELRIGFML